MNEIHVAYHSYLLRLWRVKQNGNWTWRASLEEAGTGQRRAFISLDELCRYLQGETAVSDSEQEEQES